MGVQFPYQNKIILLNDLINDMTHAMSIKYKYYDYNANGTMTQHIFTFNTFLAI